MIKVTGWNNGCKSQMIISVEIVASCSHEEENKGVGRQKQTKMPHGRKTTYYMHVSKATNTKIHVASKH